MRDIFVLNEAQLRSCVALDMAAVEVVENAFRALASGKVVMPPILSMDLPAVHGEVDVFSYGADGRPGGEGFDADIGSWQP